MLETAYILPLWDNGCLNKIKKVKSAWISPIIFTDFVCGFIHRWQLSASAVATVYKPWASVFEWQIALGPWTPRSWKKRQHEITDMKTAKTQKKLKNTGIKLVYTFFKLDLIEKKTVGASYWGIFLTVAQLLITV